jgi:hypothetical protein
MAICTIPIPTSSVEKPSKINLNWDFGLKIPMPSGNPGKFCPADNLRVRNRMNDVTKRRIACSSGPRTENAKLIKKVGKKKRFLDPQKSEFLDDNNFAGVNATIPIRPALTCHALKMQVGYEN